MRDTSVEIEKYEDLGRMEIVLVFHIPYENYARSLYPNESLREELNRALDYKLDTVHGRR